MNSAGWATSRLGDIATINMGQSPPSSTVNEDGHGIPFIQGNAEFGPRNPQGAALLRRGFFALFMGSFARGCVSPVAISGGTSSRPARTGVFSAASRASSRRRTPSVFSPTGALPSGHSRGVLVRCRGKGGRPAMAVTTGFQGRTFDVPRTCVPCIDPPRRAPCAAADAVFADAKAFLSSSEARQMSASELERELHRRGQELVRKLLQGHRDQPSPKEAAGPAEDTSGVECSEPREHESHAETASGTMQVVGLGCARRGHDGLHRLDAALNLLPERYGRIPDFPVTRSHPPASWPSAANSSICRTYRKTAGEESRRRSPVANRWMRP